MTLSTRNPDGIHAPRERAQTRGPAPALSLTATPSLPTSTEDRDGGRDWISVLVEKGVSPGKAQQLTTRFDGRRISDGVAYFDEQKAGSVGPGILVRAVEEGRTPSPARAAAEPSAAQVAAWNGRVLGWAAWCHRHLPDVCGEELHLGAFQYLWRLSIAAEDLTDAHVAAVRRSVEVWDARWAA